MRALSTRTEHFWVGVSYLVHALRNELPLAVYAGEGAVPCHLLKSVGNVSWRRRAAVCRMGT